MSKKKTSCFFRIFRICLVFFCLCKSSYVSQVFGLNSVFCFPSRGKKEHSIFIHSIDFVHKFVKYELLQGKKIRLPLLLETKNQLRRISQMQKSKPQRLKLTFKGQHHSKRPKMDSKGPKSVPKGLRWKKKLNSQMPKIESQTKVAYIAQNQLPEAKNRFPET